MVSVAVGVSDGPTTSRRSRRGAARLRAGLEGECDLALVFAAAPHLIEADSLLAVGSRPARPAIADRLRGRRGGRRRARARERAGRGRLGARGSGGGSPPTTSRPSRGRGRSSDRRACRSRRSPGDALLRARRPEHVRAEALLRVAQLGAARDAGARRPGERRGAAARRRCSAIASVVGGGAVAARARGRSDAPVRLAGRDPDRPGDDDHRGDAANVIEELASKPAIERLREAIAELEPREQALAAQGLMLGVVIDENQPAYERGDFLVRPILGARPRARGRSRSANGFGSARRSACTFATARPRTRICARRCGRSRAHSGPRAPAGALLFTCNGRGSHMFEVPDHDASALEDALGAPAGGFFCAGEIGPVGGPQLPARLHRDDRRLPARRVMETTAELVARALAEDLGAGDVTSDATVPAEARARARIVTEAAGRAVRARRRRGGVSPDRRRGLRAV